MFEKISILIPSHNRSNHIARSLDYWDKYNLQKIIVDSSTNIQKNFSKKTNYFYKKNLSFPEKILFGLQRVNTPFVAICADDDFHTENGLYEAVNYLQNNLNCSSAMGRYITFWCSNSNFTPSFQS